MTVALARSYEPEILDRPGHAERDLEGALREIRWVNRWLGGNRSTVRAVERLAGPRLPASLTVLDAGTGGGDIPRALTAWGRRRGVEVRALGVDLEPAVCRVARRWSAAERSVLVVRGDALRLPVATGRIDVVVCTLMAHHFDEPAVVALLREFDRAARLGVVVNDLRRSRLSALGIGALARLVRAHPMFRHDAPLSVLKGFTRDELRHLAREAGFDGRSRVERAFAGRLVLTVRDAPDASPA